MLVGCEAVSSRAAQPASPSARASIAPSATPTASAAPAPASVGAHQVVVTIGDSIMAAYGLDDDEGWPELLATGTSSKLVNLACSGAGFIAVGSCGSDYAGLIPQAVQARPTLVIVQSSSNDMGQSDAAIDRATSTTLAALRAALPDATIVALSTVWNEESSPPAEVASSSAAIQHAVLAQRGIYVDLGQPLEGHAEWMQSDDVHPTADGQRVLAESVRAQLAADGIAF